VPDPERPRDEREGVRPNYDRPEAAVTYGSKYQEPESSREPAVVFSFSFSFLFY